MPTILPTSLPTPLPTTALPTPLPTLLPTPLPTALPTPSPSRVPTAIPTRPPTPLPSKFPTPLPTSSWVNVSGVGSCGKSYEQCSDTIDLKYRAYVRAPNLCEDIDIFAYQYDNTIDQSRPYDTDNQYSRSQFIASVNTDGANPSYDDDDPYKLEDAWTSLTVDPST